MKIEQLTLANAKGREFKVEFYGFADEPQKAIRDYPLAVILQGGSFIHYSWRDGEPVALNFLAHGAQAVIVHYNLAVDSGSVYPDAALSTLATVGYFRAQAGKYHVNPRMIFTIGFSAGGHIAAIANSLLNMEKVLRDSHLTVADVRPDATILGYPLIDFAYLDISEVPDEAKALIPKEPLYRSAITGLGPKTPPTFIFHTVDDAMVPAENTIEYVRALKKHHVSFEYHLFDEGIHGLSLATPSVRRENSTLEADRHVAKWFVLALEFLNHCLNYDFLN